MRYIAKCSNCMFETNSYILEKTAQDFAEEHAMSSGHIIDVLKVIYVWKELDERKAERLKDEREEEEYHERRYKEEYGKS